MNHIRPFSHILSRRQGGALSVLLLGLIVALLSTTTYAQNMGNNLRGRLSPMPRTAQTITTITGEGEVRAELSGNTLTISGEFAGLSSPATTAHIHQGPKAQPGPVVLTIDATRATSGTISGTLTLTPELIAALHAESLYVQIHSETNPTGEIRGWLMH
ncbi:MAG: CHRD domain-containing protein [Pseudomonadota bacterium]